MSDLASRAERPYGCRSLEVIAGTDCLPNTNNRCTWCGRHMPRPRTQTAQEIVSYHTALKDPRKGGTDPLDFERGGPDYWEETP